ncbi:MAG: Unknown protein [uncultured Sulfurovum sp.]|uniref:Histidine kinase/HSP90-like ATPase domain-containing protein n=1 Tax=uncultured Sulfurovum sp. TaxID=269237 RepID=A0A6S6TWM2_9BACT|nr:MAG: Unknown protein [uncultured Sulfurovum sp.]
MMPKDTLLVNSRIEEVQTVYEWIEKLLGDSVESKLRHNILLITQEIVTNAIVHGNCLDASKIVTLTFQKNSEEVIVSIQDEGTGSPPLPTKEEATELDYLAENGRGLKLAVLLCKKIEVDRNLITFVFEI